MRQHPFGNWGTPPLPIIDTSPLSKNKAEEVYEVRTATGRMLDLGNVNPEKLCIKDIARGLSRENRYANQLAINHYSVARHTLAVSKVCEWYAPCSRDLALWGLLHDSWEAFGRDVPSPLKRHPLMSGYVELENQFLAAVGYRWNLSPFPSVSVKMIDALVGDVERHIYRLEAPTDFAKSHAKFWDLAHALLTVPHNGEPRSWNAFEDEVDFLDRFLELV